MKLFGRPLSLYRLHAKELGMYPWYFIKCFLLFRRPLEVISAYLRMKSPPGRVVELRRGLKIFLSPHPHDVITLFLVFVREEYGRVARGGVVVDVGANIGVFSLYAAWCGAKRVYAYEPVSGNYGCLVENIRENGLGDVVVARKSAVWSTDGLRLRFPKAASMYAAASPECPAEDWEETPTVSVRTIVEDLPGAHDVVDLLKMDCEGAEYEILDATGSETFRRIRRISLEYHRGRVGELASSLSAMGFRLDLLRPANDFAGIVHFSGSAG